MSVSSVIHIVPISVTSIKEADLVKVSQGNEEKGFTSFTCLLKTKDPAKSKEIFKSLLSKGFGLAIQCLEIVYHIKQFSKLA